MDKQEISAFLEAFYLANTPSYLFSRVKGNPLFGDLVRRHRPDHFWNTTKAIDDSPDSTISDMGLGYVALIALLESGDKDVIERVRIWTPLRMAWVPAILSLWEKTRQPTVIERIGMVGGAIRSSETTDAANSSVQIIVPSTF